MAIAVAVLAIGVAPAVAAKDNSLRAVKPAGAVVKPSAVWTPSPTRSVKPAAPVVTPGPAVQPAGTVVKPSVVRTPSPKTGIKWSGGASGVKWAVWIR